jgi:hypothetical protein
MERIIPLLIESANGHDEVAVPESKLPEKIEEQLGQGKMVILEKKDNTTEIITDENSNWKEQLKDTESATSTSKLKEG